MWQKVDPQEAQEILQQDWEADTMFCDYFTTKTRPQTRRHKYEWMNVYGLVLQQPIVGNADFADPGPVISIYSIFHTAIFGNVNKIMEIIECDHVSTVRLPKSHILSEKPCRTISVRLNSKKGLMYTHTMYTHTRTI